MPLYRAMVVHQHESGLPKDRFVNTFHISTPGAVSVADAEALAEKVRDFYTVDVAPATEAVSDQFSDVVRLAGHEVRVYPIDEATGVNLSGDGEPPIWTEVFDHLSRAAKGSRTGYPSEVAACLSYKNTTAGAIPVARRRGRIYLGPLAMLLGEEGTNQIPRIPLVWRDFFIDAAQRLATALDGLGFSWGVYSRPYEGREPIVRPGRPTLPAIAARPGNFLVIDSFWMDDAFDIQRRRGEAASTRSIGAA